MRGTILASKQSRLTTACRRPGPSAGAAASARAGEDRGGSAGAVRATAAAASEAALAPPKAASKLAEGSFDVGRLGGGELGVAGTWVPARDSRARMGEGTRTGA